MDTNTDARWELVTRRTAKCDVCDGNKKDLLRKCKICSWKICEPCYLSRNRNFAHQRGGAKHVVCGAPQTASGPAAVSSTVPDNSSVSAAASDVVPTDALAPGRTSQESTDPQSSTDETAGPDSVSNAVQESSSALSSRVARVPSETERTETSEDQVPQSTNVILTSSYEEQCDADAGHQISTAETRRRNETSPQAPVPKRRKVDDAILGDGDDAPQILFTSTHTSSEQSSRHESPAMSAPLRPPHPWSASCRNICCVNRERMVPEASEHTSDMGNYLPFFEPGQHLSTAGDPSGGYPLQVPSGVLPRRRRRPRNPTGDPASMPIGLEAQAKARHADEIRSATGTLKRTLSTAAARVGESSASAQDNTNAEPQPSSPPAPPRGTVWYKGEEYPAEDFDAAQILLQMSRS